MPDPERRRWMVETRPHQFDDVGADAVEVVHGGALRFYNHSHPDKGTVFLYAPGKWLTCCPEDQG